MSNITGRGGETIKDLAVQSGCKMNMVQDGMYANAPEKPLRMHGTPFQIQKARELVSGIIQQQQVCYLSWVSVVSWVLSTLT